jgi:hypothetical protein
MGEDERRQKWVLFPCPRLQDAMVNSHPDYKPHGRTNKPIEQLTIYARALTRLNLFDVERAWFNEEEYCKFISTLFAEEVSHR